MVSTWFIIVVWIYVGAGVLIHDEISKIVPKPYMDEIFHVPQCEKFCHGNFSYWDPKITTLPGSYLTTASILGVLNLFLSFDICNVTWMRATCALFSVGNVCLIYQIIGIRRTGMKKLNRALAVLSISTFPVLYFFSHLYYTDVFSVFFILLAYKQHLLSMNEENFNEAMPWAIIFCQFAGAFSIVVRQTNIIWVNYMFFDQALTYLSRFVISPQAQGFSSSKNKPKPSNIKTEKRRNSDEKQKERKQARAKWYPTRTDMLLMVQRKLNLESWGPGYFNFFAVFSGLRSIGFILINALFICFIFWNQGIAVGDRTAHQVTVNFPQIFYFLLFTAIMSFPLTFLQALRIIRTMHWNRRIIIQIFAVVVLFVFIIRFNTTAHPYLLADNRHYTFYVWKRLFQWFPWVKYALAPVYFLILYIMLHILDLKFAGNLYGNVVYFLFCTLNLVPQQLLEFRYFIPAYLIFRLNIGEYQKRFVLLELLWYSALNAATLYMFLYKPFLWPSSSDPQRFMW